MHFQARRWSFLLVHLYPFDVYSIQSFRMIKLVERFGHDPGRDLGFDCRSSLSSKHASLEEIFNSLRLCDCMFLFLSRAHKTFSVTLIPYMCSSYTKEEVLVSSIAITMPFYETVSVSFLCEMKFDLPDKKCEGAKFN